MAIIFTDPFIRNLQTPGRYTDASTPGLNLNIKKNLGKYWVFRYVRLGKRADLSLGVYPAITLKEARRRATVCRSHLMQGEQPLAYWKRTKNMTEEKIIFKDYARTCIEQKRGEWRNSKHTYQWFRTVEVFANPVIGNKGIDEVDTEDILKILTPIWHTRTETASRLRGRLEWILASATTRKLRSGQNPASWRGHLETILPRPSKITKVTHHKALPYAALPRFMAMLREEDSISALALEFLILNACRTGEVINGLRSEILEGNIWVIPEDRMKAGKEHRVPLGKRSIEILDITKSLDPMGQHLFSIEGKALSNMAMTMLMRRKKQNYTVHGFRSVFRDWVSEETLYSSDVAEKCLAHALKNRVEAAYRRGDLLEHRRRLMKDWEDFCLTGVWGNVTLLESSRKIA